MLETEITYVYDESVAGFPAFHTYVPEQAVSLNNTFYALRDGRIWEQNVRDTAVPRNSFFGVTAGHEAIINLIFNDEPSAVKEFLTISYEGTPDWKAELATDIESTVLDEEAIPVSRSIVGSILAQEFVEREGKKFGYIRGIDTNREIPDLTNIFVEGLGMAQVNIPALTFDEIPPYLNVGDRLFFDRLTLEPNDLDTREVVYFGNVTSIVGNVVTASVPVPVGAYVRASGIVYRNGSVNPINVNLGVTNFGDDTIWARVTQETLTTSGIQEAQIATLANVSDSNFILYAKSEVAEVSGLKGFFMTVRLTSESGGMSELFSIGSEVILSSN